MLAASNLSRTISGIKLKHGEVAASHEFTKAETDMIKYVLSIESPTCVSNNTERRLHNILTQEILPNDISQDLKNVFQIGTALYKDFRKKGSSIKQRSFQTPYIEGILKTLTRLILSKQNRKKRILPKIVQAQKLIDLARVRVVQIQTCIVVLPLWS